MDNTPDKVEIRSFQIEQEVKINATRERVFKALTEEINEWWEYRLGTKNSKLTFEPKMNGLLGMKGAVNSNYTYILEDRGTSTVLRLSHHAVGLLEPQWEEEHRHGWNELLGKYLKEYVEKSDN